MSSARGISLAELRQEAEQLLAAAPSGTALPPSTHAVVEYGVSVSVTTLDLASAYEHAERALDLGITPGELHEVLALVSGLGMHTLMEGSRDLADLVISRGGEVPAIDRDRQNLRERLLGTAKYWSVFEQHVPGFLDAVLRLSPEAFEGFVSYGAIPAHTRQLEPMVKEIISVAVDATPTHRYLPGLRLHLDNALKLGAGRAELLEALDLGASAPPPPGVA